MNLTNEEVHECLTLLRELNDRPRCSKVKLALIVIVSVIIGLLVGAMPW